MDRTLVEIFEKDFLMILVEGHFEELVLRRCSAEHANSSEVLVVRLRTMPFSDNQPR